MIEAEIKGIWLGLNYIWGFYTDKVKEAIDNKDIRLREANPTGMETGCIHTNYEYLSPAKIFDIHLEGWLLLQEVNGRAVDILCSMMIPVRGDLPYPKNELDKHALFKKMYHAYETVDDVPFNFRHHAQIRAKGAMWGHGDCMWVGMGDFSATGVQFVVNEVLEATDITKAFAAVYPDHYLKATGDEDTEIKLGLKKPPPPIEPKPPEKDYIKNPVKPPEAIQEKWDKLPIGAKKTISYYYWVLGEADKLKIWGDLTTKEVKFTLKERINFNIIYWGGVGRAANRMNRLGGVNSKAFERFQLWLKLKKKDNPGYGVWLGWVDGYKRGVAT